MSRSADCRDKPFTCRVTGLSSPTPASSSARLRAVLGAIAEGKDLDVGMALDVGGHLLGNLASCDIGLCDGLAIDLAGRAVGGQGGDEAVGHVLERGDVILVEDDHIAIDDR